MSCVRINYDLFSKIFWKFNGKIVLKEFIKFKSVRRYVIDDTFKWRFHRIFGCKHEIKEIPDFVFCTKCRRSKREISRERYEKGKMTEKEKTEYILEEL